MLNGDQANAGFNADSSNPFVRDDSWGFSNASTPGGYLNGKLAYCAVWDKLLSLDEGVILSAGLHPKHMYPADITTIFEGHLTENNGATPSGPIVVEGTVLDDLGNPPIVELMDDLDSFIGNDYELQASTFLVHELAATMSREHELGMQSGLSRELVASVLRGHELATAVAEEHELPSTTEAVVLN